MTQPLTISVDGLAEWAVRNIVRATTATLPETYRFADEPGEVVAVDGHGPWPERTLAAIDAGARAVVVIHPRAVRSELVQSILATKAPVVLDAAWRHNSTVQRITPYFQRLDSAGSMLEAGTMVQTGAELREAVMALAFTGQALLGAPITDLHDVVSTANHLTVFGTAPGLLIRLSAVVGPGPADEAWFRLVGGTEIASVHVPSSHSGASGIGTFVEPGLRITVEFAFESTHRSALSYASRILGERIVPTDLTDFLQLATSDSDDTAQFVH